MQNKECVEGTFGTIFDRVWNENNSFDLELFCKSQLNLQKLTSFDGRLQICLTPL